MPDGSHAIAQAEAIVQAAPVCRPGERLVGGLPYIFNLDLLNDHFAIEAVEDAPSDLTALSEADLRALRNRSGRVACFSQHDPRKTRALVALNNALTTRLVAEAHRRGWTS